MSGKGHSRTYLVTAAVGTAVGRLALWTRSRNRRQLTQSACAKTNASASKPNKTIAPQPQPASPSRTLTGSQPIGDLAVDGSSNVPLQADFLGAVTLVLHIAARRVDFKQQYLGGRLYVRAGDQINSDGSWCWVEENSPAYSLPGDNIVVALRISQPIGRHLVIVLLVAREHESHKTPWGGLASKPLIAQVEGLHISWLARCL